MGKSLILAIDQGTTSSRALVFDQQARVVSVAQQEFAQIYPADGWVEHDPEAIWETTLSTARQAMADAEQGDDRVVAIGITNQRETTIVWDRSSGQAVHNAIVWQDRRTANTCRELAKAGHLDLVQTRTGLLLDPYFSASKVAWILDHVDGARAQAENGELAFGTVDSFLIWRLTGGQVHATDATNASRTSLYNIVDGHWDDQLTDLFRVPTSVLPEVKDCADDFGQTDPALFGRPIPVLGVAGDQQAAALGQCCFEPGSIKSTYGTGCFVLLNTGDELVQSSNKLLGTIAYQLDGEPCYALEGSIFIAGAAVQWLRDGLKIIDQAPETEGIASALADNQGVYLVPAFTGLGAPHWDPDARGAIFGLTRDTGPDAIIRATLESVAYQTADLLDAMAKDGVKPTQLKVDGGMVANNWLLQFLADVLALPIDRPQVLETTALGAAYLAGRKAGVFGNRDDFTQMWAVDEHFEPQIGINRRQRLLSGWRQAVQRVLSDH